MKNNTDPTPHTLVIEDNPGTDAMDVVWHVQHLESCPTEEWQTDWTGKHEPIQYHTCRVQACLDGNGLDDIEDWHTLPPGEYKIRSYYEYIPGDFGGSYGAEHEIGLLLDDGQR